MVVCSSIVAFSTERVVICTVCMHTCHNLLTALNQLCGAYLSPMYIHSYSTDAPDDRLK